MKKLLGSIHWKNNGFVLAYTLYLLTVMLSIILILSITLKEKAAIEKGLRQIEIQKDIELAIYSYFVYNPTEDDFSYTIEDYTIDYSCYEMLTNMILDATITNDDYSYTVTYTYSLLTKTVNDITYCDHRSLEEQNEK